MFWMAGVMLTLNGVFSSGITLAVFGDVLDGGGVMLTLDGVISPGITLAVLGYVLDAEGHAYLERRLLAWNHNGCLW